MKLVQLEALQVFCDIAVFRSFSKAAEARGLTQPAVSRVVHQLEARLGAALVDRSRRPLQLTALGQAYYEGCKAVIEQYLELEASLRRACAQRTLTVRVAAIYSVGLGDMSHYVESFETRFGYARAHIDYLHPNQVYERVLDGTADFGLVSFPRPTKDLTVLPWRKEDMVVACAPSHPLAALAAVPPERLDREKFVAFHRDLAIRREVDRFLRDHGAVVDVALELDNIESMKKGIEDGVGVSLLPEPTLRREALAGTIRAVGLLCASAADRFVRPLGIIHRRNHRLTSAALGFIELLRANGNHSNPEEPIQASSGAYSNGVPGAGHRSANGTSGARRKRTAT
jgi:DNA-binding transcriptional LysR family regulator